MSSARLRAGFRARHATVAVAVVMTGILTSRDGRKDPLSQHARLPPQHQAERTSGQMIPDLDYTSSTCPRTRSIETLFLASTTVHSYV